MNLRRLVLTALVAGGAAFPAGAQPFTDTSERSNMAEENELIRVVDQILVRGDGANGVPAGVNVFYRVTNANACAPKIRMWTGRDGTGTAAPSGDLRPLPVTEITDLVLQGSSQLKLVFKDGTDLTLAVHSEEHRRALVGALQGFGSACRARNR